MYETLIQYKRYAIIIFILLLICILPILFSPKNTIDSRSITKFKIKIDGWYLKNEFKLNKHILAILKPQYYLIRDYINKHGKKVTLTLVYHKNNRWGAHNPIVCYKSQGWKIDEAVKVIKIGTAENTLYVNRFIVDKAGTKKIVYYYWFSSKGKITTSRMKQMFDMILNGLLYGYTESGFIEFSTNLDADNDKQSIDSLNTFTIAFTAILKEYLIPNPA